LEFRPRAHEVNWFDYVGFIEQQEEPKQEMKTVSCFPEPADPMVMQSQNRAACLFQPYAACPTCPHSRFILAFNTNKEARLEAVACPRWEEAGAQQMGSPPNKYIATEVSTCQATPFEFCSNCPSQADVAELGADKRNAGWYGRWQRLKKESDDG
jgi:hypothetical protein